MSLLMLLWGRIRGKSPLGDLFLHCSTTYVRIDVAPAGVTHYNLSLPPLDFIEILS